jgi:hypothetical protein
MYMFIPDSGFVGTAFVNALSNQLVSIGCQATLELSTSSRSLSSVAHLFSFRCERVVIVKGFDPIFFPS